MITTKQVYDYEQLIYIQDRMADFSCVSIWKHLCLLSPKEVLDQTRREYFTTFEELFEAVQEGKIWNAETWYTCFLKRPVIHISCCGTDYDITKRNFTEVCLQHHFADASSETMKSLMDNLEADEFAEYLRERNINFLVNKA